MFMKSRMLLNVPYRSGTNYHKCHSCFGHFIIPPLPEGGGGYTVLPLSVCPKIFFATFFSVTVDGRNLIFGHKRHIGMPYCG